MSAEPEIYEFGAYTLDGRRRVLLRAGVSVLVTPKAFDLLSVLVENGGRVVSKESLMERLWPDTVVEESNLTFQVSTLRKALGDGARYVATIPGRGYQFVEPVATLPLGASPQERSGPESLAATSPLYGRIVAILIAATVCVGVGLAFYSLRRPPLPLNPNVASVAVLPFKPIVATGRDEALELGMADTLITRLSHIPGVLVSPTSTVRRYSALDQDSLAAARQLGVEAVVDGSIHRTSQRMRVNVRLLRSRDGRPLWADQFDVDARDLFEVQDRVADGVARAIAPALSGRAQEMLGRRTTNDLEAYDLYIRGLFFRFSDPLEAEALFRRAIARDPRFAAAWAASASTWLFRGRYLDSPPRTFFENARVAAQTAIALDPMLSEAHAALAAVYSDHDWKWDYAEVEFRRAIELDPANVDAHALYAVFSAYRRRFAPALEHSRRAMRLDPTSLHTNIARGICLRYSGRNAEAVAHLEEALRLHPDATPLRLHLALAQTNAGRPDLGIQQLAAAGAPESAQLQALQAYASARAGKRPEALRILRDLERRAAGGTTMAAPNMALAWTAASGHDRAFYWLERAYAERLWLLRTVNAEQGFEPLRRDPRYPDLIRRMGL